MSGRRRMMMDGSSAVDYSKMLTFKARVSGTFSFSKGGLYYSTDGGVTWSSLAAGASTPTIAAGNTIIWKANGLRGISGNADSSYPSNGVGIGRFSATGNFDAYGNIMSLWNGEDFAKSKNISYYFFAGLFYGCTKLVSAEDLVLPAMIVDGYSYAWMFYGCTALTSAPALPATHLSTGSYRYMFRGCSNLTSAPALSAQTLSSYCYLGMFYGCSKLTSVPSLPATTLKSDCYNSMFCLCTSLTTAPVLGATTLTVRCYNQMFYGCSKLNWVKCMATDISATNCVNNWMYSVKSSGTFIRNSAASSSMWPRSASGIPSGWSVSTASS